MVRLKSMTTGLQFAARGIVGHCPWASFGLKNSTILAGEIPTPARRHSTARTTCLPRWMCLQGTPAKASGQSVGAAETSRAARSLAAASTTGSGEF